MGEGLVDNRKTVHKFWLLLEDIFEDKHPETYYQKTDTDEMRRFNVPTEVPFTPSAIYPRPSLFANHLSNSLNYAPNVFVMDGENVKVPIKKSFSLLTEEFPCDVHLLNLRTQPEKEYFLPSSSALLVLHRQGYDCAVNGGYKCNKAEFGEGCEFAGLGIKELQPMSLTGTVKVGDNLGRLGDVVVRPMELQTFNITFV